jgi:Putative prokaryotic signal transducing protein
MKTVLTYGNPSEAEVDKSMLESEGIVVHLLNRDSPLSAWGGPFMIQLQVEDQDLERATDLIKAKSPDRFGNELKAKAAGDAFVRGVRRFLWSGAVSITGLFVLEAVRNPNHIEIGRMVGVNLVLGLIIGIPVWLVYETIRKITKRG